MTIQASLFHRQCQTRSIELDTTFLGLKHPLASSALTFTESLFLRSRSSISQAKFGIQSLRAFLNHLACRRTSLMSDLLDCCIYLRLSSFRRLIICAPPKFHPCLIWARKWTPLWIWLLKVDLFTAQSISISPFLLRLSPWLPSVLLIQLAFQILGPFWRFLWILAKLIHSRQMGLWDHFLGQILLG